jgi:hypothetical protein
MIMTIVIMMMMVVVVMMIVRIENVSRSFFLPVNSSHTEYENK